MNKKIIILLLVILIVVIGGLSLFYFLRGKEGELIASGTIEGTEVRVSSKIVAKVIDIKVDEGSMVKEGDVLAKLDDRELKEALKSAQAKYKIAKDDFERNRKLYADKMISSQQYDAASSALDVASAALELARTQYENTVINAPISGVVLVRAIEKGELATIDSPIVTLADLSKVKLTVYLAEEDVGKVKLGEEVSVSVDSYPNEKFIGRVVYISEKAEFTPKAIQTKEERTTQVFAIKVEIPNPDLKA